MARLLEQYKTEVVGKLKQELGRDNTLSIPKLRKIVVSVGMGKAVQEGVSKAAETRRFTEARDWHPNPWWRDEATEDVDAYAAAIGGARAAGLPVLLGVEMDWLPSRRDETERFLENRPFDIVLGSVHWLADLAVVVAVESER